MGHPVFAGRIGSRARIICQFKHLHIPRQAVHLLHAGNHQIEAGSVDFFLDAAGHAQAHTLMPNSLDST